MKSKKTIQLDLSELERKNLQKNRVKISEIVEFSPLELEKLMDVPEKRAREISAHADFQRIPSIGPAFSKDLIFLGYYNIEDLMEKEGASLLDEYEKKKGYRTDPCVEDQFRLVAYFAKTRDSSKKWYDFSKERKAFRAERGYPKDRPKLNWTEV